MSLRFAGPLLSASLILSGCGGTTESAPFGGSASASGGAGGAGASAAATSGEGATSTATTSGGAGGEGGGGAGGGGDVCGACDGPGEVCSLSGCVVDCVDPAANPCDAGTVCNVSDQAPGQCVPPDSGCVVTGSIALCGASQCGAGARCDDQTGQCVAELPCTQMICEGGFCHGASCPCVRPAPSCAAAPLSTLNDTTFMSGLVDIDFDLKCSAWGVTVISGADQLKKMDPAGTQTTVLGVSNLNMGEVAAIQGIGGTFGGSTVDIALTYNCCAGCGCAAQPPQGVAHFDPLNSTLPMVIPSSATTTGVGPFQSIYLDTGPQGLTYALSQRLYVGNVDQSGDFHTIDLVTSLKSLVTTFPSRVYAAAPFDATHLLVALENNEILRLGTLSATTTLFATAPAPVTSLVRDPFTGHVYVAMAGGEIRELSGTGADIGPFAQAPGSGRIALAQDNHLYHLLAAPIGTASLTQLPLPSSY